MTTNSATHAPLLVLCRDLLFASKITTTAHALGQVCKVVRDPRILAGLTGRKLLVDLNQVGAIDAAIAGRQETGGEVVGFVSHVDAATITRARAAGIDQVLARSQFVIQLSRLLEHP